MSILLAVTILLTGWLAKLAQSDSGYYWYLTEEDIEQRINNAKSNCEHMEKQLKEEAKQKQDSIEPSEKHKGDDTQKEVLKTIAAPVSKMPAEDSADKVMPDMEKSTFNVLMEWQYNLNELYMYQTMKEKGLLSMEGYLYEAINQQAYLQSIKTVAKSEYVLEEYTQYCEYELKNAEQELTLLDTAVQSEKYADYVAWKIFDVKTMAGISEEDIKRGVEELELRLKIDPEGNYYRDYSLTEMLNTITTKKNALEEGVVKDSASIRYGQKLTKGEREKLSNEIAVLNHAIENGTFDPTIGEIASDFMMSLGCMLIALTVIILASSSVSQEMATGSIKSLIIAPCKRWKIFIAKLSSLVMLGLGGIVIVWLSALLGRLIFFGLSDAVPYVYAVSGKAHTIPYVLYTLFYLLVEYVTIMGYVVFAFMLSTVTRSTAVSTGISIGVYGGGRLVTAIMNNMVKWEMLKFIPFNHLNLSDKLFSYRNLILTNNDMNILNMVFNNGPVTGTLFSVLYLATLLFTMGWIAFDSFTRRDI